ncbi:MAG: 2-hydroxyacyl-CoA dehydratase [Planctomycetes bacterium]|nr:2-hydroxyacyl-CoA dehydratase [Planctomycetota bacterium]
MNDTHNDLVGRGNREGAQLFRDWFGELNDCAERGESAAYVFVMGSFNEILKSFDIPVVFPEINSLQTAIRKVADGYINEAEDHGYSPDICGYVKADIAMQLRGGEHPMGTIPKPKLAVLTNACNTYLKWAEAWERLYEMPVVTIDVPGTRAQGKSSPVGSTDFENDRRYVEHQIKELITVCEKVTAKKFDVDKLREVMSHTNTVSRSWKKLLDLNSTRPSVFNALTDGTVYLGVANGLRGDKRGADFFERLVEEMEYKAKNNIGTIGEEKYRLAFAGVPCYPIFRRFNEMFSDWGGSFVHSTYLWFASGGSNKGYEYDLKDPIKALSEGTLLNVRDAMDSMFYNDIVLEKMVEDFNIDGIIYHPIKSCRTVSTGLADGRQAFSSRNDIPSLFLESDMMDSRVVSEAQMKNRADAFFEGLATRRKNQLAGAK